jgi:hypothetical protein
LLREALRNVITRRDRITAEGRNLPTRKATGRKTIVKKATAKRAPVKATAKRAPKKRATPDGSSPVVSQPRVTPERRAATPPGHTQMPNHGASRQTMPAEPGDFIVIDSPQVGSPAREGEVLDVIRGEVSVSYRVQWADGHQTLIAPVSGTARIVRASKRT